VGPRHVRKPLPFEDDRWDQRPALRTPRPAVSGHPKVNVTAKPVPGKLKKLSSTEVRSFVGSESSDIQSGMEVIHERFGRGKVLLVEGKSPDLKATVFFPGVGNKQLLLKFAKLQIVAS